MKRWGLTSSIVNHTINLAILLVAKIAKCLPVCLTGNIRSMKVALQFICSLLSNVFDKICNNDFGAFLEKLLRNSLAKSSSTTSHDGDFSFETAGHDLRCAAAAAAAVDVRDVGLVGIIAAEVG